MPGGRITNVRPDGAIDGFGTLATGGARGGATPENVTITGSARGDVLVEPGSRFTITGTPNGVPTAVRRGVHRHPAGPRRRGPATAPGTPRPVPENRHRAR
ncbi:hypothetical protein [Streptomyces sp. NPDC003522]